jgi:hypothetical protein
LPTGGFYCLHLLLLDSTVRRTGRLLTLTLVTLTMNPHAPSSIANPRANATGVTRPQIMRTILTGACASVFTLVAWVVLVTLLDRPFRAYENIVWSGTLWLSAMLCPGFVAYSRHSVRPVLACTIAFGVFGLAYMVCEGPIFGVVSEGGDPSMTQLEIYVDWSARSTCSLLASAIRSSHHSEPTITSIFHY